MRQFNTLATKRSGFFEPRLANISQQFSALFPLSDPRDAEQALAEVREILGDYCIQVGQGLDDPLGKKALITEHSREVTATKATIAAVRFRLSDEGHRHLGRSGLHEEELDAALRGLLLFERGLKQELSAIEAQAKRAPRGAPPKNIEQRAVGRLATHWEKYTSYKASRQNWRTDSRFSEWLKVSLGAFAPELNIDGHLRRLAEDRKATASTDGCAPQER